MGADFLLYDLPLEFPVEIAMARLSKLPTERLAELAFDYGFHDDEVGEPRAFLEGLIEYVYDLAEYRTHNRNVAILNDSADMKWLISGGMSWGDEPTDMCATIRLLRDLRVTSERI